jgi:hypothetical protein
MPDNKPTFITLTQRAMRRYAAGELTRRVGMMRTILRKFKLLGVATAIAAIGIGMVWPGHSGALTTTQLALSSSGSQAWLTNGWKATPDGRYVVFDSNASYIVSGDTNGVADVFVRDTISGTTTRVSVDSSGTQANSNSGDARISNNGRYVLFTSGATNLADISGVVNYASGVYLRDRKLGTTELVVAATYSGGSQSGYTAADLSEDARFIFYDGYAAGGGTWQVYMKDRLLNTTTQLSKSAGGTAGNANSQHASASCDGRFVAFQSNSTNLVSGDTNGYYDVFLVDTMGTHAIRNLTIAADYQSATPIVSCDGNHVVFYSGASNLVSGDTNGDNDAFVYDVNNDSFERVSVGTGGSQMSGNAQSISADGRYVAFQSYAANGVRWQVYVRDRLNNTTTLISKDGSGTPGDRDSIDGVINFDGREVLYRTTASNLGFSNSAYDQYFVKATNY